MEIIEHLKFKNLHSYFSVDCKFTFDNSTICTNTPPISYKHQLHHKRFAFLFFFSFGYLKLTMSHLLHGLDTNPRYGLSY